MLRLACLCLVATLSAAPAPASPLADGIAAWLAGDDQTALPALAKAAQAGDPQAMVLLGALDMRAIPSPRIEAMTDEARAAIFNAPDPPRLPWAEVALDGPLAELARPLVAFQRAENGAAPLAALIAQDELGLAGRMALALVTQDPAQLIGPARAPDFPEPLRAWGWIAATRVLASAPEDADALALIDAARNAPDSLMRRVFLSYGGDRMLGLDPATPEGDLNILLREGEAFSLMEDWTPDMADAMEPVLMAAPETALLRDICAAGCPADPGGCTRALYGAAGGIFGTLALQSPLASVISEDDYRQSPRARRDLASLANGTPRDRITPTAGAQCAFGLLDAAAKAD